MKKERFRICLQTMLRLYNQQHVPLAAAGFSYYIMLAFFPMLICLYTILGNLFPAAEQVRELFSTLLPEETYQIISDFLRYVSKNLSITMSVVALSVMIGSASACFRLLENVMGEMRGAHRFKGIFGLLFSFLFAVIFLLAMMLVIVLIATGEWFLNFVDRYIMFMNISDAWSWWRFVLLFLLLYVIICGLYKITAPQTAQVRIVPGALLASGALVALGFLFSFFISQSITYPLVYGSLGSIVILLFWFYLCGFFLFLGNTLNIALEQME